MRAFLYQFPQNLLGCFRGRLIFFHFGAIILTYTIVTSGFDWFYFTATRNTISQLFLFPAVILGGLLPIVVVPSIYAIGRMRKDFDILNTSYALFQSGTIAWLVSSFYKALTGRIPPEYFGNVANATDISHQFNFGFFRDGIFWGWPSSHAAVAFAMAVTLFLLLRKNKIAQYSAIIYAFYVGIGVSMTIHWFSEFVAGAIIGSVVGYVVGKNFEGGSDNVLA